MCYATTEAPRIAEEMRERGNHCYASGDYAQAAEWYQKAANAGDAPAMYNLGCLYCRGLGVNANHEKA